MENGPEARTAAASRQPTGDNDSPDRRRAADKDLARLVAALKRAAEDLSISQRELNEVAGAAGHLLGVCQALVVRVEARR
jgi:hypothetical protein